MDIKELYDLVENPDEILKIDIALNYYQQKFNMDQNTAIKTIFDMLSSRIEPERLISILNIFGNLGITETKAIYPKVIKKKMLAMQLCIPIEWTQKKALEYAEYVDPSGTIHGWRIAKKGESILRGANPQIKCPHKSGFIHIIVVI